MICRGGILAALRAMHGIHLQFHARATSPTPMSACNAPHAFGRVHRTPRQEQVYLDLENEIQFDGA